MSKKSIALFVAVICLGYLGYEIWQIRLHQQWQDNEIHDAWDEIANINMRAMDQ